MSLSQGRPNNTNYDYWIHFHLIGDRNVGNEELLNLFQDDEPEYGPDRSWSTIKTTSILVDGNEIKFAILNDWDHCTCIDPCQGILFVYDITNKQSFKELIEWLDAMTDHERGVPKVLIGNRLHLEYQRQVSSLKAEKLAIKHKMEFFEVSSLCNFNISESFLAISRMVLRQNGVTERQWISNKVPTLQELCCQSIGKHTTTYGIDQLYLPKKMKPYLKSFGSTSYSAQYRTLQAECAKKKQTFLTPKDASSREKNCCVVA